MLLQPNQMQTLPMKTHRLRWKFLFSDGSSKTGIWDNRGAKEGDAAKIDKDKLSFAYIEIESVFDFRSRVLVEVPGPQYVTAIWNAWVIPPLGLLNKMVPSTALKIKGTVSGLSFMTNKEMITANVDATVNRRNLTDNEIKGIQQLYEFRSKEIKQ